MLLGLSLPAFTALHVVISLVAIAAGFVVAVAMSNGRHLPTWTAVFLATTVLTSVTGFLFPFTKIGPPHVFGVVSLAVLAFAIPALYVFGLDGWWRPVYVLGSLLCLYLNAVVAIVQAFQKIAFFRALAPTQSEPPFLVAQLLLLAAIAALAVQGARHFPSAAAAAA